MEKSTKIGIGLFVLVLTVGFLLIEGTNTTGNIVNDEGIREIEIDAKWYEFSHPVIEVSKGERIRIKVNNLDTTHGIYIPEFGVNGKDVVEFTADKIGEFPFVCATMCGPGHHNMRGKIIVS